MAIPLIPVLITIGKTVGKQAAIAAGKEAVASAGKHLLPKASKVITNITQKVGKEATTAGAEHFKHNSPQLRVAGEMLFDKRTRQEGIAQIAKIGLGGVGAILTTKFAMGNEPQKDILAEQTPPGNGNGRADSKGESEQTPALSQQEQTRLKNEQSQDFVNRQSFSR